MAVLTKLQSSSLTTDVSTYTFTSENLGTAGAKRGIIVAFGARCSTTTDITVTSVTINGVTATVVYDKNLSTTGSVCGFAAAVVPTGTSGNVEIILSRSGTRCGIVVYHVDDFENPIVSDFDSSTAADAVGAIDVPAGGFAIGLAITGNATTCTWTGLTEDTDFQFETSTTLSAAAATFVTESRQLAVTCDYASSSGGVPLGVFASWGFADRGIITDYFVPTGNGSTADFTFTGGASAWQSVDDAVASVDDGDTTYAGLVAANGTHLFTFATPTVPASSVCYDVRIKRWARAISTTCTVVPQLIVAATSYSEANGTQAVGSEYIEGVTKFLQNPRTTANWTVNDLNGAGSNPLQAWGYVVSNNNTAGDAFRLTKTYIMIRYQPPAAGGGGGGSNRGGPLGGKFGLRGKL